MAPEGKGQLKGKSFTWNLETTKTLLNICLDYQKAYGVDQPFSWVKISEELAQKIGKECCFVSVKNKFDHMRKLWRLWKKLWQNETCIAWNPVKGRIVADDAWWDIKIKEDEKYKQFRKKGVPPEIDDLWERIFSTIDATGKHGVAPSRNSLEADGGVTEPQSQSQSEADYCEIDSLMEELLSDAQPEVCGPSASKPSSPTGSRFKRSNGGRVLGKHKRKQSSGAALYNPDLTLVGETSHKMLTLSVGDVGISEAAAPKENYTLGDAMFVIERLLKEGSLVEGSPLWCFGVDEMLKDDVRRLFLTIPRDSGRLSWLQWRFLLAHPEMHNK